MLDFDIDKHYSLVITFLEQTERLPQFVNDHADKLFNEYDRVVQYFACTVSLSIFSLVL